MKSATLAPLIFASCAAQAPPLESVVSASAAPRMLTDLYAMKLPSNESDRSLRCKKQAMALQDECAANRGALPKCAGEVATYKCSRWDMGTCVNRTFSRRILICSMNDIMPLFPYGEPVCDRMQSGHDIWTDTVFCDICFLAKGTLCQHYSSFAFMWTIMSFLSCCCLLGMCCWWCCDPRCARYIGRSRRWMRHPTLRTVRRQLDRHCPSQRFGVIGVRSSQHECVICLSEFEGHHMVRTLPCPAAATGHTFHRDCIDPWLWARETCPLCNANCAALLGLRHTQIQVEEAAAPRVELGNAPAGPGA